jgi:hypothetical protein
MSGIIGPLTPGRIAFALGSAGVGALIGGFVAEHRDASIATGALVGASSALAGIALLIGGSGLWRHVVDARTAPAALEGLAHLQPRPSMWRVASTPALVARPAAAAATVTTRTLPSAATLFERAAPTPTAASNGFLDALRGFLRSAS